METKQVLQEELQKIEKWESDQSGLWVWDRIGRLPFKVLDKLTPKIVHEKIGLLLDELGSYIQNGGRYLTIESQVLKSIEKHAGTPIEGIQDIRTLPLKIMDETAMDLKGKYSKVAAVQGATTGFGGLFTLAIDIPALLTMSLKTLQEISIIYGFDPREKSERIFIVKCLQFSSADVVGKQAILNELSTFYQQNKETNEIMSQLQGWREVVYTYRDQFGWKKFFQMIPVAGLVFGALTNRSMINDLAEVGMMLYRKRRIMERMDTVSEEVGSLSTENKEE